MLKQIPKRLALTLSLAFFASSLSAAPSVSVGLNSSELLGGINLSDDSPSATVEADWSFSNGAFVGLDCYASNADLSVSINTGCDVFAGYFKEIGEKSALSAEFTHHVYSDGFGGDWDFSDITLNFHPNQNSIISLNFAEDWLNRGYDTQSIEATTLFSLTPDFNATLSAGVISTRDSDRVSSLSHAKASLSYFIDRWQLEAGLVHSDEDQTRLLPLDFDNNEVFFKVSYQLY